MKCDIDSIMYIDNKAIPWSNASLIDFYLTPRRSLSQNCKFLGGIPGGIGSMLSCNYNDQA
ncbi:hypothetical protein QQP08_027278 [Theobroma cacao]|nr:hypothetical protein QQP08_027278 [Theobroma cacao]